MNTDVLESKLNIYFVTASSEDNNRYPEIEVLQKISQEKLLLDCLGQENQAYPPDLLSFPLRGSNQISPATSGTSSNQDRSKSSHAEGSPIKSPSYGVANTNLGILGRFHSPPPSSVPLINPRSAYVTLPRKPRVSHWVPNTQAFANLNGVIPQCDNFGMKIFGNGGVYYTLNKSEIDLGPDNGKLVNPLHIPYCNIDNSRDFDPAPSPAPGTPHSTLPRSSLSSPNIHNQLLALQAMAINCPTQSKVSSKVMVVPSENECLFKNIETFRMSGTLGRARSVPKPPPKPRKRNPNEPFLIHSAETATQV